MTSNNLIELNRVLLSGEHFIIAGHENPDGDAVSAAFAMAKAIAMLGGKPHVLLGEFAERYADLPGNEFLYAGDAADLNGDVFIAVDCSAKERLGAAVSVFDRTATTVNIDHHATNKAYAAYNFIKPEASSTCELVYQLINHMVPMDVDIATALYTGIVFDTGGFCYGSATFETFQIASRLVRMGVDFTHINRLVLHSHTLPEAKAFGKALANLRVEAAGRIAAARITIADLEDVGADYSGLDGIVEYLLTTGNAECAVLVSERPDGMAKASLRSTQLNLAPIVARHGGVDDVLGEVVRELSAELLQHDVM